MSAPRRPLDEMLSELVAGLDWAGERGARAFAATGITPSSIEFDLPVEACLEQREGQWVVLADSPRTRLRTAFDLPASRLTARIVVEGGA
ncbi:hypothetical protein GRI75_03560 [Altererythrobacter soli]|uniref:Uncharacterized protein n=1 Tax=Croceibacterium soli TaxID=1739690 RepID=A0A6I4UQJ0_9SPHN|nr:hypothetical protein [Croceibacterium soli]MXP40726.1 hypothetical protein [Croceibacterium soli]